MDDNSVAWATAARWWTVLGGQRALLLQVADPRVAAAVAAHSDWERRSLHRLVSTLTTMLRLSFAEPGVARAEAQRLAAVHGAVVGSTADGLAYDANDPDAQAWVLATLVDSLWEVERRFVGRLTEADRDRSVAETRALARALCIDLEQFPNDAGGFRAWFDQRVESLAPDDTSRASARSILDPPLRGVPRPLVNLGGVVAADLLPPVVRERLELPAARPDEVARILRLQRLGRRVIPRLPGALSLNPLVPLALAGRRPRGADSESKPTGRRGS
ncbi:MAG: oxygenase MpaB family protein [Microthrixaceae bacterium]